MAKAQVLVAENLEQIPVAPVAGKITTVYWNICGLGQPIRYALQLADETSAGGYADVRVHYGPGEPGTEGYKRLWMDKKDAVGEAMPFPNLPYFFDGDVALTQSNTILRYIGRKFSHEGKSLIGEPSTAHIVDLILDQTADFDGASTGLSYRAGLPGLKEYCEGALPGQLAGWSKLLAGKKFFTGDSITVADLKVYETLRKLKIIEGENGTGALAAQPTLLQFIANVEELPAMRAYQSNPDSGFIARPLNNAHAQFK